LSGNSSIIIRGQAFDNTLIAEKGSATRNFVEIVDSGTIEVVKVNDDGDDDDVEGNYFPIPAMNRIERD
jgi:hypothetical protein